MEKKRLDMIAANQVGDRLGFDTDDNALTVYWPGGRRQIERMSKTELAQQLVMLIAERYRASALGQAAASPASQHA